MFGSARVHRLPSRRGAGAVALLTLSSALSSALSFPTPAAASPADSPPATRTSSVGQGADQAAEPAVSQLIVKYRLGARSEPGESVPGEAGVTAVGLSRGDPIAAGVVTVELSEPVDLSVATAAAEQLAADPQVEYAEPDLYVTAEAVPVTALSATAPSDPLLSQQWPLVGPFGIRASGAWARATGSGVVVAVLDSGLAAHPDLAGQTVAGYDMVSDAVAANDGNGRDSDPSDPGDWAGSSASSWHGTHVSGTIAAASDNSLGVAGVAPRAKIQPVRVLGTGGGGSGSDILAAIYWAAGLPVSGAPANATPAKVINMSLSGNSPSGCPTSYQQAIDTAVARGVSVVVAAGNQSVSADTRAPANCQNVVTVAAIGPTGHSADYSNFGSRIDLAAPGGDSSYSGGGVLSTINTGTTRPGGSGYTSYEGTSMAAPHVAGAVALLRSIAPALTPGEIEARLKSSARVVSACSVTDCGAGILDATALIASAASPALPVTRFSGPDRYSTAVEVSKAKFAAGSGVVLVSSAANFPDALAAGPAAALRAGPLLLVPRDGTLPAVVADELRRLQPAMIHVVGGRSAIGEAMVSQLRAYADGVDFGGTNRYDTAASVAKSFGDPGKTVFIATGANYPDALAGGAAAGRVGGTLLLTAKDQLPVETIEAFDFLDPSRIVLLGGTSAISESVRTQIQAVLPGVPVVRASGSDRFATAAATSAISFPGTAAKVYLATGTGFPDALAAAPVAGSDGAPLLLTTQACVPEPTLAEIRRLNPSSVVVLGGENAVSTTAANLGACAG